jgi:hypothetical protein
MPVHYNIHKEHRLVVTVGEGWVTFREIQDHQDQLLTDPAFDPSFNQLIDVTAATDLDLTVAEMKEITRRRIVSSGSRRAFVASSIHILTIGHLMQTYHEAHHEVEVHIFLDRGEALTWLGIKDDSGLF